MALSYKERSVALVNKIHSHNYYPELFGKIYREWDLDTHLPEGLARFENEALYNMWNEFWGALPDSFAIRTAPFFELCDLCEGID